MAETQQADSSQENQHDKSSTGDFKDAGYHADAITNRDRRIRQAIVVIHGVGEQRPMDTLRSFVDSVLVKDPRYKRKYRNKPDAMNEMFETRCLQAPSNKRAYRPLTDFYEYYWAHHMTGSKYAQVLKWLAGLMCRSPKMIPSSIMPVYVMSWVLILIAAGLWIWGIFEAATGQASFVGGLRQHSSLFFGGVFTILVQGIGSRFILGYVADAARYLTPSPDNIEARNKIRSEGIKLLRTLHENGKYNRIVVVGHSLGSVIGYDIIRNLWVDLRKPVMPYPQKQKEFKDFHKEVERLEDGEITPTKIENFQQCQHRVWQEMRKVGMPWLISDFITLGSPLAHAKLLMADNPDDFTRKKREYEYPCCPPPVDEKPYYSQMYNITNRGQSFLRNVYVPHHGATFICIRWTNIFFPYHGLIFGDLIGGRLNGLFGRGIREYEVKPSSESCFAKTLACHIFYWKGGDNAGIGSSLGALRKALRLNFLRGKTSKVKPGY